MTGRSSDQASGNIANHGQRLRIELFEVRQIAGTDRGDGGIDVFG
jgi:hypothetical protein